VAYYFDYYIVINGAFCYCTVSMHDWVMGNRHMVRVPQNVREMSGNFTVLESSCPIIITQKPVANLLIYTDTLLLQRICSTFSD